MPIGGLYKPAPTRSGPSQYYNVLGGGRGTAPAPPSAPRQLSPHQQQFQQQKQQRAMAPAQAPQLPQQPSAQMNMPQAQPYAPYNPQQARGLNQNLGAMSQAGQGLMDPNSDYYKRLSQAMQQQIGGQSAAQQRSAALRGAFSGFGSGASPEMMATTADIAQGGLEAQGAAESGLALQAPQAGAGMLQSTFSPMMGQQQLQERSRQYGAGLGEQARQFGTNTALQQQQMASQQAWQQAQLQQQQQMAQQDALMRQMSMMFGMF